MRKLREKRNGSAVPFPGFALCAVVIAAPRKAQDAVRKDRIDDQPDRRERDDAVSDDRAYAPVAHKNSGNEVEVEYTVQSPIDRPEQDKDIRHKIRNDHMRYLLLIVCAAKPHFMTADFVNLAATLF